MTNQIDTLTNGHLRVNDGVKEIPNNFSCNEAITCDMNEVQSIGSNFLFCNKVLTSIDLPNVTSIGSDFLCYNKVLTLIKTKSHTLNVVKKDNITFVVKSTKSKGDITIHNGFILNSIKNDELNKRDGYLVVQGDFSAHGGNLKEALSDLQDKVKGHELSTEPINKDTIIDIDRYHYATGACREGIRNWMQQTGTPEGLTAKELLPILEKYNAYNLHNFKKLLTF